MNFLEEIFDLFEFNGKQRQKALIDFDTLIKAKITNDLINLLPASKPDQLKNIESVEGQKEITMILKQNFSTKQIKEAEQKAIGETILIYLDFMLKEATPEQQAKAIIIFKKYNIKI